MLDCCVKKCTNQKKISRGDTYVCCWLCDNMAHVICAGFSHIGGRVVDLISSKIGLNWTCHDCRSLENDMRAFMRQTQKEFNNIFIGFRDLNERFKTMEAHFKKLKVISESPKRKKCMPNNDSNLSSSQGQSCPPTNVPSTALTNTNRLTKDVMNNAAQESLQESTQGCVDTSSETIYGKLNDARTNSGTFAAVCSTSPMLISLDSPIHPTPPPVSLAPTITVTDTGVVDSDTSVPEKNSTGSITNACHLVGLYLCPDYTPRLPKMTLLITFALNLVLHPLVTSMCINLTLNMREISPHLKYPFQMNISIRYLIPLFGPSILWFTCSRERRGPNLFYYSQKTV
ncbi:uncharacterized protein [Eurosta solidaginis]|uniref:uncharacterized protein n=1 Tax=Eurosta solidaginis TaxID=178769 RepID=UPI003530C7BA